MLKGSIKRAIIAEAAILLAVFLIGSVLVVPTAYGQTMSEAGTEAQIQLIRTSISELQAQIDVLQSGRVAGATTSIEPQYSYYRDLYIGLRGDDVSALQAFLVTKNTTSAARALSNAFLRGIAKGYFGQLTRSAVAEYQLTNGIAPSAGYFGPITQAYAASGPGRAAKSFSFTLNANPASGEAPLSVALSATVSGSAKGSINYTFWWNCSNTSASVESATLECGNPNDLSIGAKFDKEKSSTKTVTHTYSSPGTYTPKLIVERSKFAAEKRVSVTASDGLNNPPTVNIETPSTNTRFAEGSSVVIGASAEDSDGSISKVEFYRNGVKIGERTRIPYLIEWKSPPKGTYTIKVKATDNLGAEASKSVSVTVQTGESCSGTRVKPGDDIQTIMNNAGDGATICFSAGTYRFNKALQASHNQKLIGEPGAILNGSKLITNWVQEGRAWKATGQTQESAPNSREGFGCQEGNEGCEYNEDLFLDDVRLKHVRSLAEVVSGTFYFDYPNDTIYMADNPTGKKVEGAVALATIKKLRLGVTVKGFIVEKFAVPFQSSAVNALDNWTIEGNEFRLNHSRGFTIKTGGTARGNYTHDNGQFGYSCQGNDILVESNTVNHNGYILWKGGAIGGNKCVLTDGLIVRGNYVADNGGIAGLWTDINNINTVYEYNIFEDNEGSGIFHEISYDAVIRYNIARRNGFNSSWNKSRGGIFIAASPNVEVHHNELEGNHVTLALLQQNRINSQPSPLGVHELNNINIHDNIAFVDVGHVGLQVGGGYETDLEGYLTTHSMTYKDNTYYLSDLNGKLFRWMNQYLTKEGWMSFGHDTNGKFLLWQ